MAIIGRMRTPDGAWEVRAHRRLDDFWYEIVHDGVTPIEWTHLNIGTVREILAVQGVDIGDLVEEPR